MPMDFPDYESLRDCAKLHNFRDPMPGEPEETFRHNLANYVSKIDLVESMEIRGKVGWDKISPDEMLKNVRAAIIDRGNT